MAFLTLLGVCNYGLVLIFGLFLSTFISGGWNTPWQKNLIFILCPIFLMLQSPCWLILGVEATKRLYPLIVHLPLVLILIFVLKKRFGIALVSVCTAYLCCQLPRWVNLF
ncbi:MAG: ATP-binding protein, partial [Anaerotignum sp.]